MTMTPTPDTPNRTPEEILAAVNGMIDSLDEHVTITDVAAQLLNLRDSIRDGLLGAAPTEEQIERSGLKLRIAHEIDEDGRYWFAYVYARDRATVDRLVALARSGVHHVAYANSYAEAAQLGVSMLDEIEAALTAAAGVAPQEPSAPSFDGLLSALEQARVLAGLLRAWDVSEEQIASLRGILEDAERSAQRLARMPAPSPDREKLIERAEKAERLAAEHRELLDERTARLARDNDVLFLARKDAERESDEARAALTAAVPDEADLAEVISARLSWASMHWDLGSADMHRALAKTIAEWLEKSR